MYRLTDTTGTSSRFTAGRVTSALLSTVTVALVGLIAWLVWGWAASALALLIAAVYLPLVTIGDAMLSEPLFAMLTLGAVVTALLARRSERPLRWSLATGLLVGLATLSRTNGLIVLPVIAAGIWSPPRASGRALRPVGALIAATVLVLTPWTIRNTTTFHQFVPLTTQAGFTLAGTYNDASRADRRSPGSWRVPLMAPYAALLRNGGNEAVLERRFRSTALHYARAHLGYVAAVGYHNLVRLLDLQGRAVEHPAASETGISERVSDLDVDAFYVLLGLAAAALALGGTRGSPLFIWAIPAAMALSLVFVIAYMRYRLPIDPFLILLVASAVTRHRAPRRKILAVA